jgi:hypothetical protein
VDLGLGQRVRTAGEQQAEELVRLGFERDRLSQTEELPALLVEGVVPE